MSRSDNKKAGRDPTMLQSIVHPRDISVFVRESEVGDANTMQHNESAGFQSQYAYA